MNNHELYLEISALPTSLKKELKDFVEYLKSKNRKKPEIKERKFGGSKGIFKLREDFDEPFEDFKEYM